MIEVHVDAPREEHESIIGALEHWGANITANGPVSIGCGGYLIYEGEITLCGGKDLHDAHLELKELIHHKIKTKWFCIEFHDWDEVIES
jgi:hypothetical protein